MRSRRAETMDEYIDRESLKNDIAKSTEPFNTGSVFRAINRQIAADVAPVVHGRIVGSLEDGRYRRRFSCCGEDATMITQWAWPKYCPNCGAKMDRGDNDEAD
jgi:hypothetical protein